MIQESTCRHGVCRKVVVRTLNALGYRSGVSFSLNDPERINEMTSELKLVKPVELVRHTSQGERVSKITDTEEGREEVQ